MRRLLPVWIVLAACQPSDGNFLAIEPLPPPTTASIGVPVRVTAVGGHVVKLELKQGQFDDMMTSKCLTLDDPPQKGVVAAGSDVVIVVPSDVEALLVGRLYAIDCSSLADPPISPALASEQRTIRVQDANEMTSPTLEQGGGS